MSRAMMGSAGARPLRLSGALVLTLAAFSAAPARAAGGDESACRPNPLGDVTLYLRGSMNDWAASDDHSFLWRCNAFWLNVDLQGEQRFKIADEGWGNATIWGQAPGTTPAAGDGAALPLGTGPATAELVARFAGPHTLRLQLPATPGATPTLQIGPRSFDDPRQRAVTDPVALSLRHDSRAAADKRPFGAAPSGTRLQLSLSALPGVTRVTLVLDKRRLEGNQDVLDYRTVTRMPLQRRKDPGQPGRERWTVQLKLAEPAIYGYWFDVEIGGQHYAYQNNRDAIYWTRERGSGGLGAVEWLPEQTRRIRRFRQTVYAPDYRVPDWAADAVYYYIFPERFRNGDRRNDPQPGVDTYQGQPVEFHTNWLDKPYKPGSGDGSDAVFNNDFFGGDIAGIIEKLDDIRDLGANALYITPMFTAASNHKYDTADYTHIDPHFGSDEDFSRLTREAAARGIRVVPDTSLNHTGLDSIYFDRFGRYPGVGAFEGGQIHPESPWAGWYRLDPSQTDPAKQYVGWVGVADLPELNKASRRFRDFAYGAPDSVMKRWLDRGAAGWRMDVAPWVPDDFWREWRAAIKQHRPDAITIAETWFDASKFFLGDSFDSTMNYIFRNAVLDYAKGGPARQLVTNLELMREAYPPQSFGALMNLLSSHDQARSLHVLGWDRDDAPPEVVARAKQRLRLAWLLQMSYPGAPTIYYGDEVGVTGGDDPYNRAPYPWADLGGQPDLALRAEVKRLLALRQAHPVLRRGSLGAPVQVGEHTVVLPRQLGRTWAFTASNAAESAQAVSWVLPAGAPTRYTELLSGQTVTAQGGRLSLTLPAMGGAWLVSGP